MRYSASFSVGLLSGVAAFALLVPVATAQGVVQPHIVPQSVQAQDAARTQAYWTPERMKAAKPTKLARASSTRGTEVSGIVANRAADAYPGLSSGWDPTSGKRQPTRKDMKVFMPGTAAYERIMAASQPKTFGSPPANPVDYANYGKFQRWTWYGAYTTYPTSTIGRMFFKQNGIGRVCSATAINKNTILTAGHCVSDGKGNFSTDILFCPSYNAGGVNPSRGCWSWTGVSVTTSDWHFSSDIDRDYACVVTQKTGSVHANSLGNITGWIGLAWNWPRNQMVISTGYPGEPPFPGFHIIFTGAVEWYSLDRGGDFAVSKYIGNDMTGGSSGGSWWLSISHASAEYPDLDGTGVTDPLPGGGPFANGVNSHARCLVSCFTPPNAGSGTFWDEMGSPDFTESAADPRDVTDVLNACFTNGGS